MGEASKFTHCRCPRCKHALDEIVTTAPVCPACNGTLDSREVWLTRRYPGQIVLPGWLKAFGWPVVVMAAGGLLFLARSEIGGISYKLPWMMVGGGGIWFFVMLVTNGEEL